MSHYTKSAKVYNHCYLKSRGPLQGNRSQDITLGKLLVSLHHHMQ